MNIKFSYQTFITQGCPEGEKQRGGGRRVFINYRIFSKNQNFRELGGGGDFLKISEDG